MSGFWKQWLNLWCVAVALFGAVLAGSAFPGSDWVAKALLTLLRDDARIVFDPTLRFTIALMGCVTLGWAGTLWAAIKAADRLGADGADIWRLIAASIIGWYVIDSLLSVATGFALNAVSNTVFTAALLLPVWRSGATRPALA